MRAMPTPLPWHQQHWSRLTAQFLAARCPHSLLLAGQQGLGKVRFARAFAAFALCSRPEAGVACGECRDCELLSAGTHPDFMMVEPEEEGKALKVDQIRGLGEFVSHTASRGGRRVVVLRPADAMNINAANALLKNLEEPAADVYFLLVTDKLGSLLPTIRSRCQVLTFPVPSAESAIRWLAEFGIEELEAGDCLALAGGAPLLAQALNEPDRREARTLFARDLLALVRGEGLPSKIAEGWKDLDLAELLRNWQGVVHGLARAAAGLQVSGVVQPIARQWLECGGAGDVRLYAFDTALAEAARQQASGANPNRQLLLEDLLIRWRALFKPVSGMLDTGGLLR